MQHGWWALLQSLGTPNLRGRPAVVFRTRWKKGPNLTRMKLYESVPKVTRRKTGPFVTRIRTGTIVTRIESVPFLTRTGRGPGYPDRKRPESNRERPSG